jgi:hypothetical protein
MIWTGENRESRGEMGEMGGGVSLRLDRARSLWD